MTVSIESRPAARILQRYADMSERYDRTHAKWLRDCGAEAQAALEAAVRARLRPGDRLLDVGCGTGAFARRITRDYGDSISVSVADPCGRMLDMCHDFPACRYRAPLESLPEPDASQDVVTCAWALEVAADFDLAVAELARVLAPGGLLALAFCARKPAESVTARLWRHRIEKAGMGVFLDPATVASRFAAHPGLTVRPTPADGPAAALLVLKEPAMTARQSTRRTCS